jgi:fucose 4-O-acetylase-like acetyltransferase
MHEYNLAIQHLLVVICISYKPCATSSTKSKKQKKMFFFTFSFSFFRLIKQWSLCKIGPALLEEIIISLDFVAKCVYCVGWNPVLNYLINPNVVFSNKQNFTYRILQAVLKSSYSYLQQRSKNKIINI